MNFIFISPQFPHTYWNFCARLKKNGINVLGIGDTPYDQLSQELRNSLTEYYRVNVHPLPSIPRSLFSPGHEGCQVQPGSS